MTDVRLTPEKLAILCLIDATREIEAAQVTPDRWLFAIPTLQRSLYCALVAALRGSASIGAYIESDRKRWIEWFEASRSQDIPPPEGGRVAPFKDLLRRAQESESASDMGGSVLVLSDAQQRDLALLNRLRDDIEHVKPRSWSLEISGMDRIVLAATHALEQLLAMAPVRHHLTVRQLSSGRNALKRLRRVATISAPGL